MSYMRDLEDFMDTVLGAVPHLDLEGGMLDGVSGELICDCGDQHFIRYTSPGDVIECQTCGQRFAVGTRLHLLPLD